MRYKVRVAPCDLGLGLFAVRPLAPGELILVLHGRRYDRDDAIHETPLGANLVQTGARTYILPEPPGVYANHACQPNAGLRANRRLIALEAIAAGREIRFDYSTTMAENLWRMPCRCGAATCRGLVTDFCELPVEIRERYLALDVVAGFIARRYRGRTGAAASGSARALAAPAGERMKC